jgi:serine/threonine protein kinase
VPEHFVWFVLKSLAEAMDALQHRRCSAPLPDTDATNLPDTMAGPDSREGWEKVLHSDIKPSNVFLHGQDSTYPSYPKVLLADFDLAVIGDHGEEEAQEIDWTGPGHMRWRGTRVWRPPVRTHLSISVQRGTDERILRNASCRFLDLRTMPLGCGGYQEVRTCTLLA